MKIHHLLSLLPLLLPLTTRADAAPTELARLLVADGSEVCCAAISGRTIVALSEGDAHVFLEPEGGWAGDVVASATLRASDGGRFNSVAISGKTVVAGDCFQGDRTGAAYVFVEPPGGWSGELSEAAKLTASDGAPATLFGCDVVVQDDVIAVGAPDAEVEPEKHGAAYVFTRPRHGWAGDLHEQAKLRPRNPTPTEDEDGSFFQALAISGEAIFAAANFEEGHRGSVYAFTEPADGWHGLIFEQSRLTASDRQFEDHFGESIAAWGHTLVVGSQGFEREEPAVAYVFVEPAGGWQGASHEQAMLIPSGGIRPEAVAIDRDISVASDFGFSSLLSAFVEPPGGWAGRLTEPDVVLSEGPPFSRIALSGDTLIFGSRIFRLGLDADRDGLSDAMETKLGTAPLDEDSDRDGIADGSDPDWVADAVADLGNASLTNRGARRALLNMLGKIERRIAAGDLSRAATALGRLRRRMDGCEPAADRSDWIVECAAQREVRTLVDVLGENLGR